MAARIEHLPHDRRVERLGQLADMLVTVLERTGPLHLTAFFDQAAKTLWSPMSQVRFGLTYAKSTGRVTVHELGTVASRA